jgi:hypothetical protein
MDFACSSTEWDGVVNEAAVQERLSPVGGVVEVVRRRVIVVRVRR